MISRRGTAVLASDFAKQMSVFEVGDIVTSVIAGSIDFIGEVVQVDEKLNKIHVNWGDGLSVQHSPDEIQLMTYANDWSEKRMKRTATLTRRGSLLADEDAGLPGGDQFVGDPDVHGIDHPRGGGFSIMQDLQKQLAPEAKEQAEEGPKISPVQATDEMEASEERVASIADRLAARRVRYKGYTIEESGDNFYVKDPKGHRAFGEVPASVQTAKKWIDQEIAGKKGSDQSRRGRTALYWMDKGRSYRMTKKEQDSGSAACPKCKGEMTKEPFTRKEKLWNCKDCGFKVPSGSVHTGPRIVDVEMEDGKLEIEIAASRRGRMAAEEVEVPDNLSRMKIREIARLIGRDWGGKVNYAAKPYLQAMFSLDDVKDMYGMDPGSSIVAYFLSNARSWKGEVAKAVKKELKKRI